MSNVRIVNDPYKILLKAFTSLYPGHNANIYIVPGEQVEAIEKGALGVTTFLDDSKKAEILIKGEQTISDSLDVIAHELAHVVVGIKASHESEWENAYKNIFKKYIEILDALINKTKVRVVK